MTIKGKQFQRTEDGHLLLMSNEERNLLITDLTARLNYGVICLIERVDDFGPIHRNEKLTGFSSDDRNRFSFEVAGGLDISFAEKIMPYLRPMSSMTEEERKEFIDLCSGHHTISSGLDKTYLTIDVARGFYRQDATPYNTIEDIGVIDWLNEHHFDYRGLIEKGLALKAVKGMYKRK